MSRNNGGEPCRVIGKVKWFNQFKGYGFVKVNGIPEDVFLHFSVIDQSGIEELNNNDIIECDVDVSEKGYKVVHIENVLQINKYEISEGEPMEIIATVKWFNPMKGFGFAQMPSGEDIFIHSRLLKKHKIYTLEHGKSLTLIVRCTNLGYDALDLIV